MTKGYALINDDGTVDSADPTQPQNVMTLNQANQTVSWIPNTWTTGQQLQNVKQFVASGTTNASGQVVFQLTDDGTGTGNALFPNQILSVRPTVSDPSNVFGLGYALTNSNKTLTVTLNRQVFTGVQVLGINVLGSVTLSASVGNSITVNVLGR